MIRNIINFVNNLINNYTIKKQQIKIDKGYKFNGVPYIRNFGEISVGKNFKATSGKSYNPIGGDTILRIICRKDATISIGDNVGISNTTLHIMNSLIIEDNVLIGGGCKIWDTDFHSIDYKERIFNGDNKTISKSILIKKNAFIGASSIILKGVTVGENSIVGAGSVVTKTIPDNEIWGGNPAKKIKGLINE